MMNNSLNDPRVYILLPVHNRKSISISFVEQLKKQTYQNFMLVLIDDGSTDGTEQAVRHEIDRLVVIRGNGNWWWAGSLHQGYKWLKKNKIRANDVVLIMNDDTYMEADFIANGLDVIRGFPGTLLTATGYNVKTLIPQDTGGYRMDWRKLEFVEVKESSEMNCSSTRGLMMRVQDFMDTKGFYPTLIPHYLSDIEFTMRAQKLGKGLMIHPGFKIGIDFETTGYLELKNEKFIEYLKKIFSSRAAMNPIAWSNFIILHSDYRYIGRNLWRIWGGVYENGVKKRLFPEIIAGIKSFKNFIFK
ncbi:glycosyltransferase family 2 protein [Polynucleobacter paneuropaeus]|nr:glycosyltransferase family 2 protein [Polynucleobacter paneuropaeus]